MARVALTNEDGSLKGVVATWVEGVADTAVSETFVPFESDDTIFAVVDEDDRRTWLEVAADGGLTTYAADKIGPAVAPGIVEDATEAAAAEIGVTDQDTSVTGLSFAVVDEDDRRTWIEATATGKPSAHATNMMREALGIGETGIATEYKATYSTTRHKVASGPDIVCWGDSMTAGAGGGGTSYPSVLATETGRTVYNRGVGGESSVTIAARAGANPLLAIPAGGSIPASGAVALNLEQINGHTPAPGLQGWANFTIGTFAGVPGTLSLSNGVYSFTRTTTGTAVTVNRPTAWVSSEAASRRGDIAIIWVGQNGPDHNRAKADTAAIIRHLSALDKRYLVMSRPTSTDEEDAEWHDLYGRRFVTVRKYLNRFGLADAGITPTAQDEADVAAGIIPSSLRSDSIHLNAAGYTVLGKYVATRTKEMGWS